MGNRVVHVGYPKAGSSFLQMHVFPYMKKYKIIDYARGKVFSHYVLNSGMFFDSEKARKLINDESENIILSDEVLVGNPIKCLGVNDESTPLKLKRSGFNKVIIFHRRDLKKWELSLYNEFLKLGGKLTFNDFINNPSRHNDEYSYFNPMMIERCSEYIAYYKQVFGEKNVLVLFIDDLKTNRDEFLTALKSFLGSDDEFEVGNPTNESMPRWMQHVVMFFNNFTSSRMSPSSLFRWFSTSRVIRLLQIFSNKSHTKYKR